MRDGIILLTIFQLLFISIRTGLARDSPRSNANALRGFSRLSRVSRVTSRASNKEAGRTSFRTGGARGRRAYKAVFVEERTSQLARRCPLLLRGAQPWCLSRVAKLPEYHLSGKSRPW